MEKPRHVHAAWDNEARVWVASSEDVPGLATEAETSEALVEKLKTLIPELRSIGLGKAKDEPMRGVMGSRL